MTDIDPSHLEDIKCNLLDGIQRERNSGRCLYRIWNCSNIFGDLSMSTHEEIHTILTPFYEHLKKLGYHVKREDTRYFLTITW